MLTVRRTARHLRGHDVLLDPRRLLVHSVLRYMISKRPDETADDYVNARLHKPDPYTPPSGKLSEGLEITEQELDGVPAFRLRPEHASAPRCFVYFHGGSFVGQIVSAQWELMMDLVGRSACTGLVPIYPLAPVETTTQTVERAVAAITGAIEEFGAENVSLVGDSSGGAIVMAAAQQLRDSAAELPARLILLAPWIDLTMTHPDQAAMERRDLMVRRDFLLSAAHVYAGGLPLADPLVSPLYGDMTGLPPMHVFTGARDSVVTDSRELVKRVHEAGGEIEFVEAPHMQHVYPIFAMLPEAQAARTRIAKLLS